MVYLGLQGALRYLKGEQEVARGSLGTSPCRWIRISAACSMRSSDTMTAM